jgi:hypothetical protein
LNSSAAQPMPTPLFLLEPRCYGRAQKMCVTAWLRAPHGHISETTVTFRSANGELIVAVESSPETRYRNRSIVEIHSTSPVDVSETPWDPSLGGNVPTTGTPTTTNVARFPEARIPQILPPAVFIGAIEPGSLDVSPMALASKQVLEGDIDNSAESTGADGVDGGREVVFEGGRGAGQESDLGRNGLEQNRHAVVWARQLATNCLATSSCKAGGK